MEKTELLSEEITSFVAHNTVLNHLLWDDSPLLIQSYIRNGDLDGERIGFNFDSFYMLLFKPKYPIILTSVDEYNEAIKSPMYIKRHIVTLLRNNGANGNLLFVKIDNSKSILVIFSIDDGSQNAEFISKLILEQLERLYLGRYDCGILVNGELVSGNLKSAYELAMRKSKLSFFGIKGIINDNQGQVIVNDSIINSIMENIHHLHSDFCHKTLNECNRIIDYIFNNLVLNSLNYDYYVCAFTFCETFILTLSSVYDGIDEINQVNYCEFKSLASYVNSLKNRLAKFYDEQTKRKYSYIILLTLQYINYHFKENINLTSISEYININPTMLSTLFNKETKMSISDYICEKRIQFSLQLINQGKSQAEVSAECGFVNQRYFARCFKKIMNVTFQNYRNGSKK